jgi:hypothetical protein
MLALQRCGFSSCFVETDWRLFEVNEVEMPQSPPHSLRSGQALRSCEGTGWRVLRYDCSLTRRAGP